MDTDDEDGTRPPSLLDRFVAEAAAQTRLNPSTEAAVRANEAVLELDPENVDSLLRLLRCRRERSEFHAALELTTRLDGLPLDEDEQSFLARWRRESEEGVVLLREREARDAGRRRLLRDLAAEIMSPSAAIHLGKEHRSTDPELAIAYLRRGLEVARTTKERKTVLNTLGPTLRDQGQIEEAVHILEESIGLDGSYQGNKAAYTAYAATLRRTGDLDEARRHGEPLRQEYPTEPFVLNTLGAIYSDLARRDGDLENVALAQECFLEAERRGGERQSSIRYLRKLIEDVRYAGAQAEAMGSKGAMARAEEEARVLTTHVDRLRGGAAR